MNMIPCPSCEQGMELRTHKLEWKPPKGKKYYYKQWYMCVNPRCRTTVVTQMEDRVYVPRKVEQVA